MQLDNTRIAVRERELLDIMDLSLQVLRVYFLPLAAALVAGALPFALLNAWLLWGDAHLRDFDSGLPMELIGKMLALIVWEMPLAAAPATLFLGQALFGQRPGAMRIVKDLAASAPQLFVFQVLLRGLWTVLGITWLLLFISWAYLNEVILLERNPLSAGKGRLSTWRRNSNLHAGVGGEIFSRWLGSVLLGTVLVLILWLTMWYVRIMAYRQWEFDWAMYMIYLPLAIWIVVSYFTVVRFLSYLDLRIRREGWEVELRMRAEGARLTKQRLA